MVKNYQVSSYSFYNLENKKNKKIKKIESLQKQLNSLNYVTNFKEQFVEFICNKKSKLCHKL